MSSLLQGCSKEKLLLHFPPKGPFPAWELLTTQGMLAVVAGGTDDSCLSAYVRPPCCFPLGSEEANEPVLEGLDCSISTTSLSTRQSLPLSRRSSATEVSKQAAVSGIFVTR